jgi:hypothetical protein
LVCWKESLTSSDELFGTSRIFSFVFHGLVLFKEEVLLLVKLRPDVGRVEVHHLFSLWTLGWPCISHASLGQYLISYPWEGGAPSEVGVWMNYQPQWSILLNQPSGSWSKIRNASFIHMFSHQPCLPGCGAFISSDEGQGLNLFCSVF